MESQSVNISRPILLIILMLPNSLIITIINYVIKRRRLSIFFRGLLIVKPVICKKMIKSLSLMIIWEKFYKLLNLIKRTEIRRTGLLIKRLNGNYG